MKIDEMFLELAITEVEGGEGGSADVQPEVDTPAQEGSQAIDQTPEGEAAKQETEVQPVSEFEIDGEKVKIDDIREWRKGNMRQSDYTKKTQEIAQLRKQNQEAVELYEFLQNNPTYAQKLAELTEQEQQQMKPITDPRIAEIDVKLTAMQIDKDLSDIKQSDPDVDEVEILNLANQMKMPIKQAYYMWRGQNLDKIVSKKIANNSQQLTEQIKKGQQVTKTLVKEGTNQVPDGNFGLSQAEMKVATGMGLSYEEYAKWKK